MITLGVRASLRAFRLIPQDPCTASSEISLHGSGWIPGFSPRVSSPVGQAHHTQVSSSSSAPLRTWHLRLAHASFTTIRSLVSTGSLKVNCNSASPSHICLGCQLGKHTKLPFSPHNRRADHFFEFIHAGSCTFFFFIQFTLCCSFYCYSGYTCSFFFMPNLKFLMFFEPFTYNQAFWETQTFLRSDGGSLLLTALMSIVCFMEFNQNSPALTLQSRMVSVSASIAISLIRAFLCFFIPGFPCIFGQKLFIRLLLLSITNLHHF